MEVTGGLGRRPRGATDGVLVFRDRGGGRGLGARRRGAGRVRVVGRRAPHDRRHLRREHGSSATTRSRSSTYEELYSEQLDAFVLVKGAEGVPLDEVGAAVEEAVAEFPNVAGAGPGGVPRAAGRRSSTSCSRLVTALLLMAILIALFGIVNTLGLSIYERTRELGLAPRGRHEPAAGQAHDPDGSRSSSRCLRRGARARDRHRVRVGAAAGAEDRGRERARDPGGPARDLPGAGRRWRACSRPSGPRRRAAKLNVLEAISYE